MGLDISAYSHLRFVTANVPDDREPTDDEVHLYKVDDGFDRMDGHPAGLYAKTHDVHLWWHEEHGTHAIPASEIAELEARIVMLRHGTKAECPGDLAVLAEDRPITAYHGFRAGSYSGYNWWREQLSKLALRVAPSSVWKTPKKFAAKPFFELINFSDAEGVIGSTTSAKLARDFADHEVKLAKLADTKIKDADERGYFLESYGDWRRAFELAARGGFVIFH